MARARVVAYDYYQFTETLRRAVSAGAAIEPNDAPRWQAYIKQHGINAAAANAIAWQKFEAAVPVIVEEGLATDGLYYHDPACEGCLRVVIIE